MKAVLFASSPGSDIVCDLAFTNNFSATTDPVAGSDSTQGYQRGSTWINKTTKTAWQCVDDTAGAAVWVENTGGDQSAQFSAPKGAASTAGGTAFLKGGLGGAGAAGGPAQLVGGAGDVAAGGNGGNSTPTGGAAGVGSNGNGGDVVLTGGAKDGTGVDGNIVERSVKLVHQGAPTAATVSATLAAAALLSGIITVNQGAAGASAQQLPLATAMDTALPNSAAGDALDFSVINISVTAAEAASLTTNTGWTLVGDMDVAANSAITTKSAGRFRARKTGAGAWTLYRLS